VTGAVSTPSPADRQWSDLAAGLTPAKSLARIDTVTARAVTTVTVVGVLLTGLGAASTSLLTQAGPARTLTTLTVITAAASVACALVAQVLTVTRHLNTSDLVQVEKWYQRQFTIRAYPTWAATVLLLAAALLAGSAAWAVLAASTPAYPAIVVSRTVPPAGDQPPPDARQGSLIVHATVPGLSAGQAATVTVTAAGRLAGSAVASPAPDGTATIALTIPLDGAAQPVTVTVRSPAETCLAEFAAGPGRPALTCRRR